MISNERQYRITGKWAREFAHVIEAFDPKLAERSDVPPRLLLAEREGMEHQLADLQDELDEYAQLKSADRPVISVDSFEALGDGLIKARIAGGLSQQALAHRLDLKEQQIQRYEADRYASASYRRLCEVARALDVRVENEMRLTVVPGAKQAMLGAAPPMNAPKPLCLPLMSLDESRNQLWQSFATATFACLDDSVFLVSVAHAFDGMHEKPVYIPVGSRLVSLAGHAVLRSNEIDVAAMKLSSEITDQLREKVVFVTSELVETAGPPQGVLMVSARGFPANRNKMKTRQQKMDQNGLILNTIDVSASYFRDDPRDGALRIALEYDPKECVDGDGKKVSRRNLQGLSGGPMLEHFRIGDVADIRDLSSFRMQGIVQEWDRARRALVGLRYRWVLEWIGAQVRHFEEGPARS